MLTPSRPDSFEPEFHHVAIAVAEMLTRQMDDTFLWLIDGADPRDRSDPTHRTAEVANRIVVLCRRLVEEIHRYERCDQVRREAEEEVEEIPF